MQSANIYEYHLNDPMVSLTLSIQGIAPQNVSRVDSTVLKKAKECLQEIQSQSVSLRDVADPIGHVYGQHSRDHDSGAQLEVTVYGLDPDTMGPVHPSVDKLAQECLKELKSLGDVSAKIDLKWAPRRYPL